MKKEIKIEEQSPVQDTSEESAQLPVNYLSVGSIGKDDVKVYIHQSVVKALEEYARSDTKNELGSILLGAHNNALGQTSVMVSQYIEAKYTDASASTLTFTHETWEYVHKEQEKKWPELRIVGWQHTHPGYGIFLSNYDMFIQENFFNLPFQIAYVIDPVQKIRGFFCWKDGTVEKLKGYYIYDDPGKIIVPPEEGKDEHTEDKIDVSVKPTGQHESLLKIIAALAVVCVALIGAVVWLGLQLSESSAQIQELFSHQISLEEQMRSIGLSQNTIKNQISDRIDSVDTELSDNKTQIEEARDRISGLEKDSENTVQFVKITVQEDDTLQSICEGLGVDYEENRNTILIINGLSGENKIVAGQVLLIPVS